MYLIWSMAVHAKSVGTVLHDKKRPLKAVDFRAMLIGSVDVSKSGSLWVKKGEQWGRTNFLASMKRPKHEVVKDTFSVFVALKGTSWVVRVQTGWRCPKDMRPFYIRVSVQPAPGVFKTVVAVWYRIVVIWTASNLFEERPEGHIRFCRFERQFCCCNMLWLAWNMMVRWFRWWNAQ